MRDPVLVAIALGSNLGDRRGHLDYAREALSRDLSEIRTSSCVETAPVDVGPEHPTYLNAGLVGRTALGPRELLTRLLAIEQDRGRARPYAMAPRTLDLDLILYGDLVTDEPGLTIPHPRFRERVFVLAPLAEIAPGMIDPVTGRTLAALRDDLPPAGG